MPIGTLTKPYGITVTTPDHDESKPCRRWPTYLAIVLVLVLIGYPLSVGPLSVVAFRSGLDSPTFQVVDRFYWPLFVVVDSTNTHEQYKAYIGWWYSVTNSVPEQY